MIIILTTISCLQLYSEQYHLREMAYVSIGGVYGATAVNFSDDYKEFLGGDDVYFNHSPSLNAGLKFWLTPHYRLSANAEFFNSEFNESFTQSDSLGNGTVTRNINAEMSMDTYPLVFSIDYLPVEQQFKTYFSLGTGIVFSSFKWQEDINSTRSNDIRVSGTKYDDSGIYPLIRGAFGIELDFDEAVAGEVIGNLTFELRYTYIFREIEVFKNIKNEFTSYPNRWNDTYAMLPGYLSLNLQFGIEYFHTIGKN